MGALEYLSMPHSARQRSQGWYSSRSSPGTSSVATPVPVPPAATASRASTHENEQSIWLGLGLGLGFGLGFGLGLGLGLGSKGAEHLRHGAVQLGRRRHAHRPREGL